MKGATVLVQGTKQCIQNFGGKSLGKLSIKIPKIRHGMTLLS